jgi:hypothetical protein
MYPNPLQNNLPYTRRVSGAHSGLDAGASEWDNGENAEQ